MAGKTFNGTFISAMALRDVSRHPRTVIEISNIGTGDASSYAGAASWAITSRMRSPTRMSSLLLGGSNGPASFRWRECTQ